MRNRYSIKEDLQELLAQDYPDLSKVLALSSELAQTDENNIRFTVDAGIINRLGKELVGKAETAVSELVKNSFDADALHADVTFVNAERKGGTLIIEDDGTGMDRDGLINGFMRLSSTDKIHNPHSYVFNRIRAGQKGFGRFATQRLGSKLTIITQTKESDVAIKTVIYWNAFETDTDLITVANRIEYVDKVREQGTTLTIENLQDAWSDSTIMRVYKHLANLMQPESLDRKDVKLDTEKHDPGFTISLYKNIKTKENLIANEDISFLNYALATIEGFVDSHGQAFWRYKSERLSVEDGEYHRIGKTREDDTIPYTTLRNIRFKTSYFLYERSLIPGNLYGYIKNLGNELGGIKIYRNGFRVPPYGDKGNDWLGLDESVRRRTYIFPHQNQSFFGFVEINPSVAMMFEETSNREGIILSQAFEELRDFVYRSLMSACSEIASLRGRKSSANQKGWEKKGKEKVEDALGRLSGIFNEERKNGDEQKDKNYKKAFEDLREGLSEQDDERQKLIDENNMLRIVAGLGLAISEFVHEIKHHMAAINADLSGLRSLVVNDDAFGKYIMRLSSNMTAFKSYLNFFDESVSRNVNRNLESINLKREINKFIEVISNDAQRAGITLSNNTSSKDIVFKKIETIPMHPSEWDSILFNLYSNSKKAIFKAKPVDSGKIDISCGSFEDMAFLEFSDNGTGVKEELKGRIFDAFFTTTSAAAQDTPDSEMFTSTGLGLKIVNDIVSSYDGRIFLTTPKAGFKTTFRIEIKKK